MITLKKSLDKQEMIHDNLTGFVIQVSSVLAGGKKAILTGNNLYVSPAMYDLMKHASPDELIKLLQAIEVIELPPINFEEPFYENPFNTSK